MDLTTISTEGAQPSCAVCGTVLTRKQIIEHNRCCSRRCATQCFAGWSPERNELLKKLWADGNSASVIAAQFGVTRNAIIGKVHRMLGPAERRGNRPTTTSLPMGWSQVTKQALLSRARKPQATPRTAVRRVSVARNAALPIAPVALPHARSDKPQIWQLRDNECKYPHGDVGGPDFHFCGAPTNERSYCDYHHHVCNTPVRPSSAASVPRPRP